MSIENALHNIDPGNLDDYDVVRLKEIRADADRFAERLTELADRLIGTGPDHFVQSHWVRTPESNRGHVFTEIMLGAVPSDEMLEVSGQININECGTAACLFGHAALIMLELGETLLHSTHVSAYYGMPGSWSAESIETDHPGFFIQAQYERAGWDYQDYDPDEVAFMDWMSQLYAVRELRIKYIELVDQIDRILPFRPVASS